MITLIGVKQAKEGYAFIHQGPSSQCEGCKYYRVCIDNLEVGRIYQVSGLREKVFPCELHEVGVRVVEVTELDIQATLPSKLAIDGAVITFNAQDCDLQICENHKLCVPRGLFDNERCAITEIAENVSCLKGLSLVKVVLHRLPAS